MITKHIRILYNILFYIFVIIGNILLITDIYLTFAWGHPFDINFYYALTLTTALEAKSFLHQLYTWQVILGLVLLIPINFLIIFISKWIASRYKKQVEGISTTLIVISIFFTCYLGFRYLKNPILNYSITDASSLTRMLNILRMNNGEEIHIMQLYDANKDVADKITCVNDNDSTIYIVAIGETHNQFHSPYGLWSKTVMPRMEARVDSAEICVYYDALATMIETWRVMKTIYSFADNPHQFWQSTLFPVVFREAGYNTYLYDFQYKPGDNYFIGRKQITDLMFDFVDPSYYEYDGEMINNIQEIPNHSLLVINLNGQHFTYGDRTPKDFPKVYSAKDYADVPEIPQDIAWKMADYDNATLYLDSVLDSLIEKFEDRKVCLFYFSDHGEVLYPDEDYSKLRTVPQKGLRRLPIPFFVWGSKSFRQDDDRWQSILNARNFPITTNDFAVSIVDFAGIGYEGIDKTRCIFSQEFKPHHRLVLESQIDYDAERK